MAAVKWILISVTFVFLVEADDLTDLIGKCGKNKWCTDCITAQKECAWCNDTAFNFDRCSTKSDLDNKCSNIVHPDNKLESKKNISLQDSTEDDDPVQLQPQHVMVKLRPGKELTFNITYRIAENVPVDLYFVLDFSTTMNPRLQKLADLTQNLIDGIKKNFTTNINIGFGSFLDKRVQPFHITTEKYMQNPCILTVNATCAPSYGYIHRRKLTKDTQEFVETIRRAETSGNFDPMEGGLDAMLQAAVCPEIIGWRNQSRRVMIYISDSGFHFAGDGKLAGIDKPNDGQCHLVKHGDKGEFIYSEETTQDYPSLGQVAEVLEKNKINTFFLVSAPTQIRLDSDFYTGGDYAMYKDFKKMIKQAEVATMNDQGAEDIVENIKKFYLNLSESVEISAEGIPEHTEVSLASDCGGTLRTIRTIGLNKEDFRCIGGLKIGEAVKFVLKLKVTRCPDNTSARQSFKIHPVGLQESLTIDMEYICDCNCIQNDEMDETKCSQGNGTYECGVCRCKKGRSGEFCQCSGDGDHTTGVADESNCKKDNSTEILCSNKGVCKCGQCLCNPFQTGKYCECDSSECIPQTPQEKCGGPERGECVCDTCRCKEGYAGTFCECKSNRECIGKNEKPCSGNGVCVCGECKCRTDYSGKHCEICPRCDRCQKCGYKDCVKCLDQYNKKDNDSYSGCQSFCKGITVEYVKRFRDRSPCGFFDNNDCQIAYMVECDNVTEVLLIAEGKQCTMPPDPLLIALPILAGIIGVGLFLLIIWKILTSFYDKIEYARFEHETKNPRWNRESNPIYDPPVTTNINPTYQGTVD